MVCTPLNGTAPTTLEASTSLVGSLKCCFLTKCNRVYVRFGTSGIITHNPSTHTYPLTFFLCTDLDRGARISTPTPTLCLAPRGRKVRRKKEKEKLRHNVSTVFSRQHIRYYLFDCARNGRLASAAYNENVGLIANHITDIPHTRTRKKKLFLCKLTTEGA